MCGRDDDARIWTMLQMIIEEFKPATDVQDRLDKKIFETGRQEGRETLAADMDPPSPRSKPADSAHSLLLRPTQSPTPLPISLARVDSNESGSDVEDLLDGSSACSVSSSSCSSRSEQTTPARNRFMTFLPPDSTASSSSRARESVATILPISSNHRDTAAKSSRYQHTKSSSSGTTRAINTRDASSASLEDDAYPDPYGISPVRNSVHINTAAPSTSRLTSTKSPTPQPTPHSRSGSAFRSPKSAERERNKARNQGITSSSQRQTQLQAPGNGNGRRRSSSSRPSPVLGPTNPTSNGNPGNGRRGSSNLSSGNHSNSNPNSNSNSKPGNHSHSNPNSLLKSSVLPPNSSQAMALVNNDAREALRKRRCGPLLQWWRCYVNDVSRLLFMAQQLGERSRGGD
jgi:hypothetical protein